MNGENIMENIKTENFVEMPFFVGYHAAENGIGKVMIKESNNGYLTIKTCGDDGIWDDNWWTMSKKDFDRNWLRCQREAEELMRAGKM
jgi:hypothetical protein